MAPAVTASEPKARDFPHPACAPIPGQPQPWHPEYFPGAVTLGNKYEPGRVQMRLVNHGSQTWQPGQVSLGYHRMRDDNTEIDPGSTPLTPVPVAVPPQGSLTMTATFAFLPPGQHLISWDLYVANVGWLSTKGICTFEVRYALPNQPPSVTVQYPPNGGTTTTRTPLLTVHGDDPDAWPNRELQWQFRMCEDAALTVGCHVSAWTAFPWYTVPEGLLDWNETFYWLAKATDGSATTDPFAMGLPAHRVNVVVPAPDQWRTVGAGLGIANHRGVVLPYGIWTRTETDAQVGATGMPLRVQRTFSSGAPANHQGAFGQGWLSMFDEEAVWASDRSTLTITYPDGRQEIFGRRADGSFVSRVDSGATNRVIVGQDGMLIVRTSSGETATYDSSGRFTRVSVEGGGALRMERDGGGQIVGVVQEPSGRRLDIQWTGQNPAGCTARPRIAAIETTAPAAGQQPLRWQYRYSSSSRCEHMIQRVDPTGQITTYELPNQYGERTSEYIKTPEHRLVGGVTMGPNHGWYQNPDQGWEVLYVRGWTPDEGRFEIRVTRPLPGHVADWTQYHNMFGGPLVEICDGTFDGFPQTCTSPQLWFFDELNRLRSLQHRNIFDPLGAERVWFYDANNGRFTSFYDENFNIVSMQYDGPGNLKGSYTFRDANTQVTRTSEFHMAEEGYPQLVGRMWWKDVSPRQGEHWDPFPMFTYDEAGRLAGRRGNPTPEAPNGPVTAYTYTAGNEPSVGGPRGDRPRPMPRGLLRTVTTAAGTTTLSYNAYGDLAELVDPVGLRTTYEYDQVGRRTAQTVYSDSVPNGARTEYRYDAAGRITQQFEPAVRNEVTGETQQKRICTSYDRDGNPRYVREMNAPCVDADGDGWWDDAPGARSMLYVYDSAGRPSHVHNIVRGNTLITTKLEYAGGDRLRRITDDVGRVTEFAYDARKRLTEVSVYIGLNGGPTTTRRVIAAYGYDPAGRVIEETDAIGRRTQHEWTDDDLPRRVVRAGVELSSTEYDGAGRITKRSARGEPTRRWSYDSEGKPVEEIVDPDGLNRRLRFTYDPAGRVVAETLTDGTRTEQTRYAYNAAGHLTERTVENGNQDLTTRYTRDQRGLPVRVVDPRGAVPGADPDAFATDNQFDVLGRLVRTEAPAVTVEKHGDTPRFERTVATTGYTLFGEVAQEKDPDGGITETEYDQLGRRTARVLPEAPGPDGTPVRPRWEWRYNDIGELLEETDPRGAKTTHTYAFPPSGPSVADLVDIDGQRVVVRTEQRDWAGQPLRTNNALVGRTDYVYDVLGQLKEVREPYDPAEGYASSAWRPHIIEYDARGYPYRRFTPAGDRWDVNVNNAGEPITVQAPGLGGPTRYTHDVAGRVTSVTDPAGRVEATDYDLAGRQVATRHLAPNGTQLDRSSVEYDPAGNVVAMTSPRGARSTYQVDALGRTTAITQPVSATESIVTSAGYDKVGNLTRTTEGLNRATWHTYNAWGLRTSTIEPATPAHPDPGERTWTTTYDAGGLPVRAPNPAGSTSRVPSTSWAGSGSSRPAAVA